MSRRKLRPAIELVSAIGSLGFDLQHHDEVQIAQAVSILRSVNGPMFDWIAQVLSPQAHAEGRERGLRATNLPVSEPPEKEKKPA